MENNPIYLHILCTWCIHALTKVFRPRKAKCRHQGCSCGTWLFSSFFFWKRRVNCLSWKIQGTVICLLTRSRSPLAPFKYHQRIPVFKSSNAKSTFNFWQFEELMKEYRNGLIDISRVTEALLMFSSLRVP